MLLMRLRHRLRFPHKILTDLLVWGAATPLAYVVRFDGAIPEQHRSAMWVFLAVSLVVKAMAVLLFRLNVRSWRKFTFRDVGAIAWAVGVVMILQAFLVAVLWPELVVPRSIPLMDGGASLLLLFGLRAFWRRWDEHVRRDGAPRAEPVLIVGAGEAGTLLAREMQRHPEMGLKPVGFVDDDPDKQGMRIADVEVVGTRDDLPRLFREFVVSQVLLAMPSAEGTFVRDTVERVRKASEAAGRPVATRVMPGVYELLSGDVSVSRLRPVQVEDLLRRKPVQLDAEGIRRYVEGRTVLVTGAGGSIGGEIARQLVGFGVGRLVLLGRGENSLYEVTRSLSSSPNGTQVEPVLASVRDERRLESIFERWRPEVVFHAAAHKHVPLMEAHPEEAVMNNVLGTRYVVEAALRHGVRRLVNVSTDKAVNPTSVMGASKRVAECVVKDAALRAEPGHEFVSVRFGNVLGSRGSVVPLFRRQIEAGGPVTITDRRMTRYFMTIPEASQLVLQAGALAKNGCVYLLDMGEPVRIADLAEDLIRLSGMEPHVDVEMQEVGMRPGEKLYEELTGDGEAAGTSVHEKISVVHGPDLTGGVLGNLVADLDEAVRDANADAIVTLLHEHVEGSRLRQVEPST